MVIWTEEEIEFLKNNWDILFKKDIKDKLKKSYSAITNKAKKLGLIIKPRAQKWSEEEIIFLKNNFQLIFSLSMKMLV